MSVFGVPVTDLTLQGMSRYRGKKITQEDRAREAMNLIQAEGKNLDALSYAMKLKASYGDGVSTLCMIYNATGGPVKLVEKKDWSGYVYEVEPPRAFDNGQWIAFLHIHPSMQNEPSQAARVYRGQNVNGEDRDFFVAWSLPWSALQNSAYTEVREKDHFPQYWDYLKSLLENAKKITIDETDKHCKSTVSVGGNTTSEFIAILEHKFSP